MKEDFEVEYICSQKNVQNTWVPLLIEKGKFENLDFLLDFREWSSEIFSPKGFALSTWK